LPLILKGKESDEIDEKVRQMLEIVGLMEWKKHRPIQLSGGQQQRVAIARALITSPPIVLADKPTGNLDFNTSTDILNVLVDMKKRFHQSMIVVTHDPFVATYTDRVLFFHDGQIVDVYRCTYEQEDLDRILKKFRKIMGKSQ
jgi:putative ABC transport system ATP-binding protein